jgi:poly-beta-1,6-N-acetyl-D-glucosamine biosynthesis protein PgaD
MSKLILDQYKRQTPFKKYLGNTLTGLGWAFWIYLWLPLIGAISMLLHSQTAQQNNAALQSILTMTNTLRSHMNMVAVMIGLFLAWSILQWIGKQHRLQALNHKKAHKKEQDIPDIQRLHQAKSMIVFHDKNGMIQLVKLTPTACQQPNHVITKVSKNSASYYSNKTKPSLPAKAIYAEQF